MNKNGVFYFMVMPSIRSVIPALSHGFVYYKKSAVQSCYLSYWHSLDWAQLPWLMVQSEYFFFIIHNLHSISILICCMPSKQYVTYVRKDSRTYTPLTKPPWAPPGTNTPRQILPMTNTPRTYTPRQIPPMANAPRTYAHHPKKSCKRCKIKWIIYIFK